MSRSDYEQDRAALRQFLCDYFNSNAECKRKQGKSICPMGQTASGAKDLKVRWAIPGGGKSGGLRLRLLVDCGKRIVKIAYAELRKDA